MLLRESLGNMNCRTTMIAHISASPRDFSETLSTIQIASRVLRMKKKKTKQYTSSSSGGESSCEEGRMRRPTHLRPFHQRGDTDSDLPLLRLSSDPDEYSSSEQSCDTVIYVGPNGAAVSDRELTDNEGPPEFVPIIPALLRGKSSKERAECLKCNTFAELQERLDCIDGSEEVAKFPFEEVTVIKQGSKQEPCLSSSPSSTPALPSSAAVLDSETKTGQSLFQLIEMLLFMFYISIYTMMSPFSFFLYSRESLNLVSCNSDGKARPLGSPRLGIASLTKTSEYRPPSSPSQRCKVYTQKGVMPATPPLSSHTLAQDGQTAEALTSDSKHLSSSFHMDIALVFPFPFPFFWSAAGPAVSVVAVGPVVLGEDEPMYAVVPGVAEDQSVTAEVQGSVCRPTSIMSFGSDCDSVTALASRSQPISNLSDLALNRAVEGYQMPACPVTTSGVAMAKLRNEGEAIVTGLSTCGSPITSWMSDLSMGSEADQSLHSFSQSQSQQGEALADPDPNQSFGVDGFGEYESSGRSRRGSMEGELVLSENLSDKSTPTKDRLRKLPPSMAKTNIQILTGPTNISPFKSSVSGQPCVAVKPMVIQEPTIISSPTKTNLMKDPVKCNAALLASISSEMSFEDPWLKRGTEEGKSRELVCEVKPEKREAESFKSGDHGSSSSGGEVVSSPDSFKRVVDGCEMVAVIQGEGFTSIYSPDIHRTASLPRGWHRLNRHDGLDNGTEYCNLGVTTSTPCSPRATLDRWGKQGFFSQKKGGIPPLPPVRKSSLDQRNRAASPLHLSSHGVSSLGSSQDDAGISGSGVTRQRGSSIDSSRLFSAKLEQLANRTNSLGRVHSSHNGSHHYDCFSLERGESLKGGGVRGDSTMPRTGRSLTRAGSVSSPSGNSPAKTSGQSKISAVSKLLMTSSPKSRSLSASSTKTLSFSTKSLSQTSSRSSSLPPNGKRPSTGSWSTQSLSRSRGGSLTAKLPLRAVNGRISELLQGSAGSVRGAIGGGAGAGGVGGDAPGEERAAVVQTLPSPYSKITAPRKPHRCSSGHASDNSSVLSGELPPAMGKTALFYHSGGSSGYESMLRDSSENTGSTSSAQDSLSEHSSATTSSRRSSKSSKKSRSNTGLQRRRLIPALTLDSSSSSPSHRSSNPGACWVDGPLGPPAPSNLRGAAATTETFEIKVYEIDDVERLQKRKDKGWNKEVVYVSAKLRLLEHRQQRISEVRAKYQCLKKELEQTKQYLMLEPHKWTNEFDLQQPYEVDSLEYLEALETVTDKLETRVNFCKAHLMMITCFDVSSRHRYK
uniref:Kinesin family member 26Ba n=1 Tax=Salarias fasciatus TaxID=181472 RepID=A0A672FXE4_SALFA